MNDRSPVQRFRVHHKDIKFRIRGLKGFED